MWLKVGESTSVTVTKSLNGKKDDWTVKKSEIVNKDIKSYDDKKKVKIFTLCLGREIEGKER